MINSGNINSDNENNTDGFASAEKSNILYSNSNIDGVSKMISPIFVRWNAKRGTKCLNLTDVDENVNYTIPFDDDDISDSDMNTVGDMMIYLPDTETRFILKQNGGVIIKAQNGFKISKGENELMANISLAISRMSDACNALSSSTTTIASFGTPTPLSNSSTFASLKNDFDNIKNTIDNMKYVEE